MENLQRLEDTIELKDIVIHKVNKITGKTEANVILASSVLTITNNEKRFVSIIHDSYTKKSNPTHGIFDSTYENDFQKEFKNIQKVDFDFYQFSVQSSNYYRHNIESVVAATGGYLIFINYNKQDNDYLLVMTIENKNGFFISDDLKIKNNVNIDLAKIDVACLINITRWNESLTDDSIKTYLTFVEGKKGISQYFLRFIGCEDKTTASESTGKLIDAIEVYCTNHDYEKNKKESIKESIYEYSKVQQKNKQPVLLSEISKYVNPDDEEDFLLFASDAKIGISGVIKIDRSKFRTLKYIIYDTEDLKIKFINSWLKTKVKYDKRLKKLTFKEIPDDLIKILDEHSK